MVINVKDYLAVDRNRKEGIYLATDSQMDRYLEAGWDIYQEDESRRRTLIATPEDGFLIERPVFPERMPKTEEET